MTFLQTPYRSPLVVVEAIKDIIADKKVCELGAACGDLMIEMQKYAKEVVGIENNVEDAQIAQRRNLDVVIGDILIDPIPQADVYYLWVKQTLVHDIFKRVTKGLVILGADTAIAEDIAIYQLIDELHLIGQWRVIKYHEGIKLRQAGVFKVFITEAISPLP